MSYYMFNVSIAIELILLCSSILDYMTSHHNTLSDITSQYTVLHCSNVLNGITLYCTVLHGIYMVLPGIAWYYIALHCGTLRFIVLPRVVLRIITLCHSVSHCLDYISLHCITFYYILSHVIAFHCMLLDVLHVLAGFLHPFACYCILLHVIAWFWLYYKLRKLMNVVLCLCTFT